MKTTKGNIVMPTNDTKKQFARSYALRRDPIGTQFKRPRAASVPYDVGKICSAYGWPTGVDVAPGTIVIGELGGKVYQDDIAAFAAKGGFPPPTIHTSLLPGADDSPSDADGEVALDWQLAAQVWSYMTGLPADIVIIYGPNSGQAFTDVTNAANALSNVLAGSWSWGSPEDSWGQSDLDSLNAAITASPYPWFAASGDNDSNDGTSSPVIDMPSGLPAMTGCGGTTKPQGGNEVVWNNGNGEGTGGGFSKIYQQPTWQPTNSQGTGRMVPDLAANADPATGYEVLLQGAWQVFGGTSCVAPLMAGFLAVVNGSRIKQGLPMIGQGQLNPSIWKLPGSFYDITNGNNGTYHAGPGPDPCTGMGVPLGTLVSALDGTGQIPPSPPVPPVPPQPPSPPAPPPPTSLCNRPIVKILEGILSTILAMTTPLPAWATIALQEIEAILQKLCPQGLKLIKENARLSCDTNAIQQAASVIGPHLGIMDSGILQTVIDQLRGMGFTLGNILKVIINNLPTLIPIIASGNASAILAELLTLLGQIKPPAQP